MSNKFIVEAFDEICQEAKNSSKYYLALYRKVTAYGGPEEGGWWRHHEILEAYQVFETEEAVLAAEAAVTALAKEMNVEERRKHGDRCLKQWADAERRGLDVDDLYGPDGGADEYVVRVTEEGALPESYIDSGSWA